MIPLIDCNCPVVCCFGRGMFAAECDSLVDRWSVQIWSNLVASCLIKKLLLYPYSRCP